MIANCPSVHEWHQGVRTGTRAPILFGVAVLVAWIGGFGTWAAFAPIDGAVVSSGSFVTNGQNKLVQHLEGGIVRDILVKEGDIVTADQLLVRLDETAVLARHKRLLQRHSRLLALQARLQAEITAQDQITFPQDLLTQAHTNPEIAEIIQRQRSELEVRRQRLAGEVELLKRERTGHEENLDGFKAQMLATQQQVTLFKSELRDKVNLLNKALIRKSEVMAIQRAEARAVGDLGQMSGRIGDTKERIARTDQQIQQVQTTMIQRSTEELRSTEAELDDIREQARAAGDIVNRIELTAPVHGIVVKMHYHTRGGVIPAGATVLELVPIDNNLVIESRVSPTDVVHIKPGQPTHIRLSTANQRTIPFINGEVSYVSADAVNDQDSRRMTAPGPNPGSFVVRVKLDEIDLKTKVPDFKLLPGTPVELFIKTGERTFMSYVMKPVLDSFSRAFREQ